MQGQSPYKPSKSLIALTIAALLTSGAPSAAKTSGGAFNGGGGGDATEIRVNEIRSDILKWINDGSARDLTLPTYLTYQDYVTRMTAILAPGTVVIGFIEKDDARDPERQVTINGVPKTCRGFQSKIDGRPHILCSIPRFKATADSEQYQVIHHEFASLVRVERNEGASSDYFISSQLNEYLSYTTVLRLGLKKTAPPPTGRKGFDPLAKLAEARALLAKHRQIIEGDKQELAAFEAGLKQLVSELRVTNSPTDLLRDLVEKCAREPERAISNLLPSYVRFYTEERARDVETAYAEIEERVRRFLQAESCQNCDPETRAEAMSKYRAFILEKVERFQPQTEGFDLTYALREFTHKKYCDFSTLFYFERDTAFEKYFVRSFTGGYHASLSPSQILDPAYHATLTFIAQRAPIKVEQTAALWGHASSKFDDGVVRIRATYDYDLLTGVDNKKHPELVSPIDIVHRDR